MTLDRPGFFSIAEQGEADRGRTEALAPSSRPQGPRRLEGPDELERAAHRAGLRAPGFLAGLLALLRRIFTSGSGRRRRFVWRSPLTRRILALNVLTLMIPVLGLLHLEQYRDSLIEAELEALRTQARAFSTTVANAAVVVTTSGEERLLGEASRHALRVLLTESQQVRARLFVPDESLIADSFALIGPGGQVNVEVLPPPEGEAWSPRAWARTLNRALDRLPGSADFPLYEEAAGQQASDFPEVIAALSGARESQVRRDRRGGMVLSVAEPVQRYHRVLGALMVSKDGSDITAAVGDRRIDILFVFAVALGVTVLLSFYLAGTIAQPIRRLAEAADAVRHSKGRQVEIPDFSHRADEVGDLSVALREMTAALWKRLDAIERFAADVSHEIKNPLTSVRSAVETVARIDNPEQQKRLIAIILDDVQRLDRLISDISDASRLDSELSRAASEPVDLCKLLSALVEVHRATLAEEGPRLLLHLPGREASRPGGAAAAGEAGLPLVIPGLEGRLGQVFRNLISNALTFCPRTGTILLSARREPGSVVVTIEDDGPGIPEGKLQAIFERFYTERPRSEKFGTHSGLGLSISKQIVEAHGGRIHAENRLAADGGIIGARFVVRLPSE